uniref:RRM domain-containing protein n=1 Tax=Timema poppense TaxID=170557 RepID=A0A7R9HFI2_TIMPO|nr:unnamed protein product [Timema poppensis]
MTGSNKIVQITNIAPQATRDQMQTLFGYLGKIEDIRLYPTIRDVAVPVQSRICYVKFHDHVCVGVAQHMTNTVFIDRALIVIPYTSGDIPDEQRALEITNQGSLVPGLLPAEPKLPPHVTNHLEGIPPNQVITTHDPRLEANGLPLYPPLPATLDARRIEEIRRTLLVAGIESSVTPQQLIDYFSSAGEVKYVRFCSRDGDMEHYALLEFSDQNSIIASLQMNGSDLNGKSIKVYHSTQGIVKPQAKSNEAAQREIEEAMSRVKEAQNLISAAIDPVIGLLAKEKKRSRSGSRSRRSRSPSHHGRRRSRSRGSRRRTRSRSSSRRGGRSRRSHSRSRDRRRRSHSRKRKSNSRSRSRSRKRSRSISRRSHSKSKSKSSHSKSHEKSKDKDKDKEKDKDKKDDKKEFKKENSKKEDEVEKKNEDSTAENETTENGHIKEADPEKDKDPDKKSKSKEKDSKEKDKSKEKSSRDKSKSSRPKSSSRSPLKSRRRSPSRRTSRSPSRKKSRSPSRKKSPGHARRRSASASRRRSASRSRKRSRSPRSAHSRPSPPRKRSRSRSKGRKDSDKKKEKSHERDKKDKGTDKDKKREKKESEKETENTSKVPRNYDEEEEGFDAPENEEQPKKEGSPGSRSEKGGSNNGDDQADEDMDISTSP